MTPGRVTLVVSAAVLLGSALAYLRDPPWLIRMETGFRGWGTTADGARARWTGGHASFFVRSNAAAIVIPIRTTFASPSDGPVTVTVAVDDRAAQQLVLTDDRWHAVTLPLPRQASRRVRRIDIRVNRTRAGNRGLLVGEVQAR